MTPIRELLARIRWDPAFGAAQFVVGYRDKGATRYVALQALRPDPDNPGLLDLVDESGAERTIPLHRIREVLRNGELIWRRPQR